MTHPHLHRDLAPVDDDAWNAIESEAVRALTHFLAGRRLADFVGPLGWHVASVPDGRLTPTEPLAEGTEAAVRGGYWLAELRSRFDLPRSELEGFGRGARDAQLDPVVQASRRLAAAEDSLVFSGAESIGARGIAASSPHPVIDLVEDFAQFPRLVARGVTMLRDAAVGGPYGVAVGSDCYTRVIEETERGGYPVLEHVRLITGGPVIWAPTLSGSVVTSMRGGDFELVCGSDLSVGYHGHHDQTVSLYLVESVTFRNLVPEAAVVLRSPVMSSSPQ